MASLFINGTSFEVVGDGRDEGSLPGAWKRDDRFQFVSHSFGYVTTVGDAIPDSHVGDVAEVLAYMYASPEADPDEEAQ